MHSEVAGLASLVPVLNTMAMLIALGGAWVLLATRWRQLQAATVPRSKHPAGRQGATERINRFFYGFGFASLALAWLLSTGLASV